MKALKSFICMLIMLLPITFSSCSSDDSPSGGAGKIVGAWTYTDDGITYIYTFNADGTFSSIGYGEDEYDGYFEELASGTYEYVEEESTLVVHWTDEYESGVDVIKVVSASSNKLVWDSEYGTITLTRYKD